MLVIRFYCVLMVDCGAADPLNIICLIIEKRDILFKLGYEVEMLDTLFAFNVIDKIDLVSTLTLDKIPE